MASLSSFITPDPEEIAKEQELRQYAEQSNPEGPGMLDVFKARYTNATMHNITVGAMMPLID